MSQVGSWTGDYIVLSDEELLQHYEDAVRSTPRVGWHNTSQKLRDLRQVILWRMQRDLRGRMKPVETGEREGKDPSYKAPRRKGPLGFDIIGDSLPG